WLCDAPTRSSRCCFFFYGYAYPRALHSFPTRRSSDLSGAVLRGPGHAEAAAGDRNVSGAGGGPGGGETGGVKKAARPPGGRAALRQPKGGGKPPFGRVSG